MATRQQDHTHRIELIFFAVLVKGVPWRSVIVPSSVDARTGVSQEVHRGRHRVDYTDNSSPSGSGRMVSRIHLLLRLMGRLRENRGVNV
jgi:hypothetical protein